MCGLSGIIAFNSAGEPYLERISGSLSAINHRGPDYQAIHRGSNFAVAHARLSILDLSPTAHQPFFDESKKNFILHNGEIFNFHALKEELRSEGAAFRTSSDTEVILKLFSSQGVSCYNKLDGFFATVITDIDNECCYLARDPVGVKPLYYYSDEKMFAFSSELQGLMAFGINRQADWDSLYAYFQLSYIPQPYTALLNVKQVKPGHYLKVDLMKGKVEEISYQRNTYHGLTEEHGIVKGKEIETFEKLFNKAVEKRLISDVPLGAFLSGGLDSSAVVASASAMTSKLRTFSIGFTDDPFYDESHYAEEIARHFKTEHHTIKMSTHDMLDIIPQVLEHSGEPFGDSSAIAVFLLCKVVGKDIKVALSGDGSDELLGGYNKHMAVSLVRKNNKLFRSLSFLHPLLSGLPQSRHSRISNKIRQFDKFIQGAVLSAAERYWEWCCFKPEQEVKKLVKFNAGLTEFYNRKAEFLNDINTHPDDLNRVLFSDLKLVLPGDMLVKTDRMSMANALEIRSPFLDHDLIRYSSQLPSEWKVNGRNTKIILRKMLSQKIPDHILNRAKQGFEVPLHRWLNGELKESLVKDYFNEDFIRHQSIFDFQEVNALLKKLASGNPGDSAMQVWAMLVFQYWWKKYLE